MMMLIIKNSNENHQTFGSLHFSDFHFFFFVQGNHNKEKHVNIMSKSVKSDDVMSSSISQESAKSFCELMSCHVKRNDFMTAIPSSHNPIPILAYHKRIIMSSVGQRKDVRCQAGSIVYAGR